MSTMLRGKGVQAPSPKRPDRDDRMRVAKTHRNIVFRLLPQTKANWHWLETTLESQRQPFNAALEERMDFHRRTRGRTFFDQCKGLTECRKGIPEMMDVSTRIRRGTLKRLDEAFQGFFGRVKKGGAPGFPRIKGRHFPGSISIVSGVKAGDGNLCVPAFGEMAIRRKGGNPCPEGRPVPAVLWRRSGRWQAIACHAAEVGEPAGNGHATGLDRDAATTGIIMPAAALPERRDRWRSGTCCPGHDEEREGHGR